MQAPSISTYQISPLSSHMWNLHLLSLGSVSTISVTQQLLSIFVYIALLVLYTLTQAV